MTTGRARIDWLRERRAAVEGLEVVDERYDDEDGWGHRHVLVRGRRPRS